MKIIELADMGSGEYFVLAKEHIESVKDYGDFREVIMVSGSRYSTTSEYVYIFEELQ